MPFELIYDEYQVRYRPNLAVSHFMVEYGVGLEQVEHTQLTGTQRSREVACTPHHNHLSTFKGTVSWDRLQKFWQKFIELEKCTPHHNHLSTFEGTVSWDGFQKCCQKFKELGKCTPHNHLSTINHHRILVRKYQQGVSSITFFLNGKIKNTNRSFFIFRSPLSSILIVYNLRLFYFFRKACTQKYIVQIITNTLFERVFSMIIDKH